jgi:hypothetical protein
MDQFIILKEGLDNNIRMDLKVKAHESYTINYQYEEHRNQILINNQILESLIN